LLFTKRAAGDTLYLKSRLSQHASRTVILGDFMNCDDIKGVIFDLDGTLLDSMHVWDKVDIDFLARRGMALPDGYQKAITSMSYTETAIYTKELFGFEETVEQIVAEWHTTVYDEYAHSLELKPGAKDYLSILREKGIKVALATGSDQQLYEPTLRNNGVYGLFDVFVTLSDVTRSKVFPDIYLKAAEKLCLEPAQCLVFEDIIEGIRSAKAAGMKAVGVYDASSAADRGEIELIADGFIMDFTQLLR
jgi:HAD superfamily hydrolase (TIGR01509 family)